MFTKERVTIPIVITGHVDHGKSTLIGRLLYETGSLPKDKIAEIKKISKELGKETELAYLTDQLREERERNMTIDTTQIFFKTRHTDYVIIDSPGHAELIRNMISGATQAQAAVLIVDIAEGVKDQTRRHASVIEMLGIKRVIVVCNKLDLAGYKRERFESVKKELLEFLGTLKIRPLFVIPISAKDGVNISSRSRTLTGWYKGSSLIEALDTLKTAAILSDSLPLRLPVQDIYEISDNKVAVGRIASGELGRGQNVAVYPAGDTAAVARLMVFEKNPVSARRGENIGIVLSGAPGIKRGDVIARKDHPPAVSDRFRTRVFWMAEKPLILHEKVTIRCSSQQILCQAEKIDQTIDSSTLEIVARDADRVKLHEVGTVVFKADQPAVTEPFELTEELGRFTIERDDAPQGAGIIIQ